MTIDKVTMEMSASGFPPAQTLYLAPRILQMLLAGQPNGVATLDGEGKGAQDVALTSRRANAVATTVWTKLDGYCDLAADYDVQYGDDDAASYNAAQIAKALASSRDIHVPDFGRAGQTGSIALTANVGASAVLLSQDNRKIWGEGVFKPVANAEGYAPDTLLRVTGDNNIIDGIRFANTGNVTKKPSDASHEYPFEALRLAGDGNTALNVRAWHFTTPLNIRGGTRNKLLYCHGSVRQEDNLAFANDGILVTQTSYPVVFGCIVGLSEGASLEYAALENVTGASSSTARCGIAVDANVQAGMVGYSHVGEGFVSGIHSEGSGARGNKLVQNEIYKQRRNGYNLASGPIYVDGGTCYGSFDTWVGTNSLRGVVGSVGGNVTIVGLRVVGDLRTVDGVKTLANADRINLIGMRFEGDFANLVSSVTKNIRVDGIRHTGNADRIASIDKSSTAGVETVLVVRDCYSDGLLVQLVRFGSGAFGVIENVKGLLKEGYDPSAASPIRFDGSLSGVTDAALRRSRVVGNSAIYVGTTDVSGTYDFINHAMLAGNGGHYMILRDNTFDTSIWSDLIGGSAVDTARVESQFNSSETGA